MMNFGQCCSWLDDQDVSFRARAGLIRAWVVLAVALFVFSWRLWLSQSDFPQVPFFRITAQVPAAIELLLFSGVLVCLVGSFIWVSKRAGRYFLGIFAVLLAVLILLDQHRLQPWAYQFLILSVIFAATTPRQTWFMARVLTISIYLYSALSKFDFQFFTTLGPDFFRPFLDLFGAVGRQFGSAQLWRWTWIFPFGELLVGLALIFPKGRSVGLWGAVLLHAGLLWILGPMGLNHQPGVLLWNLFFIVQAVFLFGDCSFLCRMETRSDSTTSGNEVTVSALGAGGQRLAFGVWFAALLLPFASACNFYDHWPGWELYAPRTSRVKMELRPDLKETLPQPWLKFWKEPEGDAEYRPWCEFDLAQWSLTELGVPIYPQDRFQAGVALALARRLDNERGIRITWEGPSDRWTGERATEQWLGRQALELAVGRFRVNAEPRPF